MQDLRDGAGQGVDWESKKEERRAYIEGGARRVVGKGVAERGEMGGERRGKEEVEGLEGLLRGLERGQTMQE